MKQLILIRGLPGVGKSTLAKQMVEKTHHLSSAIVEADEFFELNPRNVYAFNKGLLPAAHGWCQGETRRGLKERSLVVVANTFSRLWELEPYVDIANQFGAALSIADLFESDNYNSDEDLAERCVHEVPLAVIEKMRERWEKVTLTCVGRVYSIEIRS